MSYDCSISVLSVHNVFCQCIIGFLSIVCHNVISRSIAMLILYDCLLVFCHWCMNILSMVFLASNYVLRICSVFFWLLIMYYEYAQCFSGF